MSRRRRGPRAGRLRRLGTAAIPAALVLAAPAPGVGAPPRVTAPQAIVVEPVTGDVVFRRDADRPRPIASATKLMTALVVLERVRLDEVFEATDYAGAPIESKLGLEAGEPMAVRDLLRALLLASANDAAETVAVGTAGSVPAFVELMNERARALGLRQTRFANPIGLDEPGNHSSAADLAELTLRLRRIPFFDRTVDLGRVRLGSGRRGRVVVNRNDLIRSEPIVDGVKTGRTEQAGYVLVGSATRGGVTVVSVVLGDSSEAARDADTLALLLYGLGRFRSVRVMRPGQVLRSAAVKFREEDRVGLVPARALTRVLGRGERAAVAFDAPRVLEGPLAAGAPVGSVTVRVRGRVIARIPLLTAARVPEVGLGERALDLLLKPGTLALIGILAGAVLALVLLRRRRGAAARRIETESA